MQIKVMTFNIRYDNPNDGKNRFVGRRSMIRSFLRRERPHIIGFQESVPEIRWWLAGQFPEYRFLAVDAHDACRNDVAIAYREDFFDLFRLEQFWLSEAPDVPNSRYPGGSPFPRMATLVTLIPRDGGRAVTVLNSHLDHISDEARHKGAALLLERLTPYLDTPCFLTGDFNAVPESAAVRLLASCASLQELTAPIGEEVATFHDYGKITESCKLDYIFASRSVAPIPGTLRMHTDQEGGVYLSDHYPISIEVEI